MSNKVLVYQRQSALSWEKLHVFSALNLNKITLSCFCRNSFFGEDLSPAMIPNDQLPAFFFYHMRFCIKNNILKNIAGTAIINCFSFSRNF